MTIDPRDWPDHPVAVIFTSRRASTDNDAYEAVAARMLDLVRDQPGFLGVESARGPDRVGITVSYWRDQAAATAWKNVAEHLAAQAQGRQRFYESYHVRIATIERAYQFPSHPSETA